MYMYIYTYMYSNSLIPCLVSTYKQLKESRQKISSGHAMVSPTLSQ